MSARAACASVSALRTGSSPCAWNEAAADYRPRACRMVPYGPVADLSLREAAPLFLISRIPAVVLIPSTHCAVPRFTAG
jgi:hypothetical protein